MDIVSPESVGLNSRQLDRIGDWAAGYVAAGKLPFATTLVARHGQVAFSTAAAWPTWRPTGRRVPTTWSALFDDQAGHRCRRPDVVRGRRPAIG